MAAGNERMKKLNRKEEIRRVHNVRSEVDKIAAETKKLVDEDLNVVLEDYHSPNISIPKETNVVDEKSVTSDGIDTKRVSDSGKNVSTEKNSNIKSKRITQKKVGSGKDDPGGQCTKG